MRDQQALPQPRAPGFVDEIMAIEAIALYGHKKVICVQRTTIDRHAIDRRLIVETYGTTISRATNFANGPKGSHYAPIAFKITS